jgi:hypothetical protein
VNKAPILHAEVNDLDFFKTNSKFSGPCPLDWKDTPPVGEIVRFAMKSDSTRFVDAKVLGLSPTSAGIDVRMEYEVLP